MKIVSNLSYVKFGQIHRRSIVGVSRSIASFGTSFPEQAPIDREWAPNDRGSLEPTLSRSTDSSPVVRESWANDRLERALRTWDRADRSRRMGRPIGKVGEAVWLVYYK